MRSEIKYILACVYFCLASTALFARASPAGPEPWRISLGAGTGVYQLQFDELLALPYTDPLTGRTTSASRTAAFTDVGKVPFNVVGRDSLRQVNLRANKGPWTLGGVYQDKKALFGPPPAGLPFESIRGNLQNSSRFAFLEYRFRRKSNLRPFGRLSGGYSRSRYAYKDALTYVQRLDETLYHAYLNLDSHFRIASAAGGLEIRKGAFSMEPFYRYDFVSFVSNLHVAPSYRLHGRFFTPLSTNVYADPSRTAGAVDAANNQVRHDHLFGIALTWTPIRRLRLRVGAARNITAHRWNGDFLAIWMLGPHLGLAAGANYSEFTVFNALSRSAWVGPLVSFRL